MLALLIHAVSSRVFKLTCYQIVILIDCLWFSREIHMLRTPIIKGE